MEDISVLQVALAFATLVVGFFPLREYHRRPKLISHPNKIKHHGPAYRGGYFGFTVENKGKNVARNVCGEVEINNTSTELINWNNWYSRAFYGPSHTERILQIDIHPGDANKRWFFVEKLETDRITPGKYELSVQLRREYLGQLKELPKKKYSLNYTTWEESEIIPK